MRFINIKLFTLSFLALSMFSCQEEEELDRKGKPVLTLESSVINISEGQDAVIKLNFPYQIKSAAEVRIEPIDLSATFNDDYAIPLDGNGDPVYVTVEEQGGGFFGGNGYYTSFPSLSTSGEIRFTTTEDNVIEGTESFKVKLFGVGKGEVVVEHEIIINIIDSSTTSFVLDWSGQFNNSGTMVDFCSVDMDLDFYYLDPVNGEQQIAASYNNCPETISLPNAYPDGTYYLDVSFWDNGGYSQPVNIPAKLNVIKSGIAANPSTTTDLSTFFPLASGGVNNGNSSAIRRFTIVKSNNLVTVSDQSSTVVFQGKVAQQLIDKKRVKK